MQDLALLALDATNFILVIVLVALGLVIIFGLMNVINMAHGELFLLGAYTLVVVQEAGGGFWLGLIAAPIVVGLVGLAVEWLIIRHIYHRFLDTILATWGLSIAIKQAVVLVFGPASKTASAPIDASVMIFGAPYPIYRLFIMGASVAAIVVTLLVFFHTRFGLAARGVIARPEMAACLGVDTRAMNRATFAYGAALAGFAGAVMAPIMSVDPEMGLGFLVPAFLAILVGGTGHLLGVLVGATIIGGVDSAVASFWSPVAAQVVVFGLAIVAIRLFPRGITGGREQER